MRTNLKGNKLSYDLLVFLFLRLARKKTVVAIFELDKKNEINQDKRIHLLILKMVSEPSKVLVLSTYVIILLLLALVGKILLKCFILRTYSRQKVVGCCDPFELNVERTQGSLY